MMRDYLDRMLRSRPREIALEFQKANDPRVDATGFLVTSEALSQHDVDLIRASCAGRTFVDGEIVKVSR